MLDSQKRIAGAFLVGAVLIAGSFLIREQQAQKRAHTQAQRQELERKYIDAADSDHDGIPDWQDALMRNTEPIVVSNASSTYTQPTTVTGQFGIRFFEDYVYAKMYGDIGPTNEELVQESSALLAGQATDILLNVNDITLYPNNDAGTLHAYGNQVAGLILAQPNSGDNEAIILQDYIRYKKPERLLDLDPIIASYEAIAHDLLATPVPDTYVTEHLNLLNAVTAIQVDVTAMRNIDEDPLYTLLRLKRYQDDVQGLSNALSNLFDTLYTQDDIRWTPSEPVSGLIHFPEQ